MKRYRCLKETMHRRAYNLVRKELYAVCSRCAWHATFWRSCGDNPFVCMIEEDTGKVKDYYNWKLVSKNRKQWMEKRFIKVKRRHWNGEFATYYGW